MRAMLEQVPPDVFDEVCEDPLVMAFIEMTSCEESHDGDHHFPFHIQKQVEREDCICCGKTKREIQATFLGQLRRMREKPGSTPKPGSFPRFGDPGFPKPK